MPPTPLWKIALASLMLVALCASCPVAAILVDKHSKAESARCEWARPILHEDLRACVARTQNITQEACLRELGYWKVCKP